MTEQEATQAIVEILKPFKRELSDDIQQWDADADIREIVRNALRELDTDGAGGCRLCMS